MKNSVYKYIILGFAGLLALASCKVTQNYQTPALSTENLYREATGTDSTTIADLPWKSLFTDPVLQSLIEEGLMQNLDLKSAVQRIQESQATLQQSRAAFLPNLSGSLQATKSKSSAAALNFPEGININLNTVIYQAALSTSWEADIWGKLRSARRGALASLLQTEAARRAVQTQLISNIAATYYELLALDQQLKITEQTLEYRIEEVETMKALKEAAIVTGAAVVQSEANRYAAEVSIPDLKQNIRETENALSILLARAPGAINRSTLNEQQLVSNLQIGIPAQLLRNRPDVQEAEFAFRAAFENTNVARTNFYPSITITGAGGLSSLALENLFTGSIFYNLAGGLTQPIFNQGLNKAQLRIAQAQQQQALNTFQQTLLTAGQEVSNSLYSYENALAKQQARKNQLAALEKSVEFTRELLHYSSATNYTDVLTSEQSLLSARLNSIGDRLQELQAIVNVYRAVGGGTN